MSGIKLLTSKDYLRFGLRFNTPHDELMFSMYVKTELENRIRRRLRNTFPINGSYIKAKVRGQEQEWFAANVSGYLNVLSEESARIAWRILWFRDKIENASVDLEAGFLKTPLSELDLFSGASEFLSSFGMDTVGDIIEAGDLTYLEKQYMNKVYDFIPVTLEYILGCKAADFFTESSSNDSGMKQIFELHKSKAPEEALSALREYAVSKAKEYIGGLINEDEFLRQTNPIAFLQELYALKGINGAIKITDKSAVQKAQKEYTETGKLGDEPWITESIGTNGDPIEAAGWFLRVTSELMIPLEYHMPLSCFGDFDEKTDYPKVIKKISPPYECFMYFEECLNIKEFISYPISYEKEFIFNFKDGTKARFRPRSCENNEYTGDGIIEGYMEKPGTIVIEIDNGTPYFCFDWVSGSAEELLMQTVFHIIPHGRWLKYNTAVTEKAGEVAREYRALRKKLCDECGK